MPVGTSLDWENRGQTPGREALDEQVVLSNDEPPQTAPETLLGHDSTQVLTEQVSCAGHGAA